MLFTISITMVYMNHTKLMFQDPLLCCTKKVQKNHNDLVQFRHGGETHFLVLAQTLIQKIYSQLHFTFDTGRCEFKMYAEPGNGPCNMNIKHIFQLSFSQEDCQIISCHHTPVQWHHNQKSLWWGDTANSMKISVWHNVDGRLSTKLVVISAVYENI